MWTQQIHPLFKILYIYFLFPDFRGSRHHPFICCISQTKQQRGFSYKITSLSLSVRSNFRNAVSLLGEVFEFEFEKKTNVILKVRSKSFLFSSLWFLTFSTEFVRFHCIVCSIFMMLKSSFYIFFSDYHIKFYWTHGVFGLHVYTIYRKPTAF